MGRHLTETGLKFREKFGYTGKITKEAMGKELWNEWCKLAMKKRWTTPEHKKELEERREKREAEKEKKLSDPLWKKKRLISKYLKYTYEVDNVENFKTALSDNFKGWFIHHRKETEEGLKSGELIELNMYYNRPAEELIFLKKSEHARLHAIKDAELAYKKALEKIERAKNAIKAAEKTIEYCKNILEK